MVKPTKNVYIPKSHKTHLLGDFRRDLLEFNREFFAYSSKHVGKHVVKFEGGKNVVVSALYRKRGKHAKRLMHSGMAGIAAFGVMVAPIVANEFPGNNIDPWANSSSAMVLSATDTSTKTVIADRDYRERVIEYEVKSGETLSEIANKFGISVDTVRWENDLASRDSIKDGQILKILPVTGISHVVKKGDTVYSIAKKYDVDPQGIVNYPFNTFVNDETFELAIGQSIIVPDGVKPQEVQWSPSTRTKQVTPNAGTVVASGQFAWPTQGSITQYFSWYHKAIDVANRAAPPIVAADAGTVIVAGWPDNYGYGNRVVIDHGNGFKTLYAHMSRIYVVPGQTVNRGDILGQMGTTGRSTGIHLHFEVIKNGVYLNPLSVLQ